MIVSEADRMAARANHLRNAARLVRQARTARLNGHREASVFLLRCACEHTVLARLYPKASA